MSRNITAYQKQVREYIDTLYSNFDYLLDNELISYLNKRNLTSMYLLLLRVAGEKTYEPMTENKYDITFCISKGYIQERMEAEGISGASTANKKINELCRLGFIRKIINIDRTTEMYCILDLSPRRIRNIKATIDNDAKNN